MATFPTMMHSSTTDSAGEYRLALAEHGQDLSGRPLGKVIRAEVLGAGRDAVILDFDGVESLSPSLADEAFGLLALAKDRPRIRVINATPDIVATVRFAVGNRSAAAASSA